MAKWVKEYDPELISRRLEKVKRISSDGKVLFNAFEHSEYVVLLNSMISLDDEIPEIEKQRIINQATSKAGRENRGRIFTLDI